MITCKHGHARFRSYKNTYKLADGTPVLRTQTRCLDCAKARMLVNNRGYRSVKLSKMLYGDVEASAKAHGRTVLAELAALVTAALGRERR